MKKQKNTLSTNIVLFPTHDDYCKKCKWHGALGECMNEKYIKNSYYVVCVWRYCRYREERK